MSKLPHKVKYNVDVMRLSDLDDMSSDSSDSDNSDELSKSSSSGSDFSRKSKDAEKDKDKDKEMKVENQTVSKDNILEITDLYNDVTPSQDQKLDASKSL